MFWDCLDFDFLVFRLRGISVLKTKTRPAQYSLVFMGLYILVLITFCSNRVRVSQQECCRKTWLKKNTCVFDLTLKEEQICKKDRNATLKQNAST
jgi:hypothetical protein